MLRWPNLTVGGGAFVGRRGAAAAGGSAVARGVRSVLELDEGEIMELNGIGLERSGPAQGLRSRRSVGAAVDEVSLEVAPGESVADRGSERVRQVDVAVSARRAGASDRRQLSGWEASRSTDMPEARLARLRRHAVGFVFQAFHLVDELTALENVELPALLARRVAERGAPPRRRTARAGRAVRPCAPSAFRAVRWAASAGRDRAGAGERADGRACRRADRATSTALPRTTCCGCSINSTSTARRS